MVSAYWPPPHRARPCHRQETLGTETGDMIAAQGLGMHPAHGVSAVARMKGPEPISEVELL
jgi:hypothetical protein